MEEEVRKPITLLMAEDDEDDRMFAEEALEESKLANELYTVENGEELVDYMRGNGEYADRDAYPLPDLILLDLNMPKLDGREALQEIKDDPGLRQVPVVVLTTSQAEEDIYKTYDMGVSSYITKPVTFEDLVEIMKVLGQYWFEIVKLPQRRSTE